ncbi:MAG TPA: helix-turn-helix domain-containing protein [Kiritimatiellia bacterium]|nr:helix-turn-helix domain-containing protein [Kiritimatiellia bacterium]HRZ10865.1 helix-turn-helix domain-containing protein [Kiritimatiellia bacterium]HSA18862.1 helix-turn-helix domain-containing protein [Kiritimatiellia bacterium]
MPDIGQMFREARERKKVSCSQAASATRMKVQHVEALERNDFSRMAAPMYAKGFIRLYADYLGLDPEPLIREYAAQQAPGKSPSLKPEERTFSGPSLADLVRRHARQLWARVRPRLQAWRRPLLIAAVIVAAGVIGLALLRGRGRPAPAPAAPVEPPAAAPATPGLPLPLLREPPDAYLDGSKPLSERTPASGSAR